MDVFHQDTTYIWQSAALKTEITLFYYCQWKWWLENLGHKKKLKEILGHIIIIKSVTFIKIWISLTMLVKPFPLKGKSATPLFSLQHLHSLDSSQSRSTPETLPQKILQEVNREIKTLRMGSWRSMIKQRARDRPHTPHSTHFISESLIIKTKRLANNYFPTPWPSHPLNLRRWPHL